MKKCSNCFKVKPTEEFYPRKTGSPYPQSRCKDCNAEVVRAYMKRKQQRQFSDWVKNGEQK